MDFALQQGVEKDGSGCRTVRKNCGSTGGMSDKFGRESIRWSFLSNVEELGGQPVFEASANLMRRWEKTQFRLEFRHADDQPWNQTEAQRFTRTRSMTRNKEPSNQKNDVLSKESMDRFRLSCWSLSIGGVTTTSETTQCATSVHTNKPPLSFLHECCPVNDTIHVQAVYSSDWP